MDYVIGPVTVRRDYTPQEMKWPHHASGLWKSRSRETGVRPLYILLHPALLARSSFPLCTLNLIFLFSPFFSFPNRFGVLTLGIAPFHFFPICSTHIASVRSFCLRCIPPTSPCIPHNFPLPTLTIHRNLLSLLISSPVLDDVCCRSLAFSGEPLFRCQVQLKTRTFLELHHSS